MTKLFTGVLVAVILLFSTAVIVALLTLHVGGNP